MRNVRVTHEKQNSVSQLYRMNAT